MRSDSTGARTAPDTLFEDRFSARLVRDEDHWRETCRYVLENPVKAGICVSALDWPWSGGRYLRENCP